MATKYQYILDLYELALKNATRTPAEWTAFLRSACRNYKCRFDEQMLIYAQRPDATAVLEIEKWNTQFGRWVNRGAKGIAVFDDRYTGYRLKHYFDISDTHESDLQRPVTVWQMKPGYEAEVIEGLENSFGDLEDKSSLADALISAARNATEDNISDYLSELINSRDGSFLEELDEHNVEVRFRTAVRNSIAFMLLSRCSIDPKNYFDHEDFEYATDFNTKDTANALGLASSDISEMCLREIAANVLNQQRREQEQNRTFAFTGRQGHTANDDNTDERGASNDRTVDIPDRGRLQPAEPDRADGSASGARQVRAAQEEVPEAAPPPPVPEPSDVGDAELASDGDRADVHGAHGADHTADGGGAGRDGAVESIRPDEVGQDDEQHPGGSRGDSTGRPVIRIKPLPMRAEQLTILGGAEETDKTVPSAFSISQQIIDEVLTSGGNEENSALRIVAYFKKNHSPLDNADFLQREYRIGGKGFIFGSKHVSVWFDNAGMHIAQGDTVRTADAAHLTWEQAAKRIRELLDLGRYMPQGELDNVDVQELRALAGMIDFLHRDRIGDLGFTFMDPEMQRLGSPDRIARIEELLAKAEGRQRIHDDILELAVAVEQDGSLLRFHVSRSKLKDLLTGLEDLQIEPLVFAADETISTARPGFITQDEVDQLLVGGSYMENGKLRIYSYFLQNRSAKDKADFLKEEYGTGGSGRIGFSESHDPKGIVYSRENNRMPYDKVTLPWPRVAKRIDELIAEGRYISQWELGFIPEFEMGELAKEVRSFYHNQLKEIPRPYPYGAEYSEALKLIRQQLDEPGRITEILRQMAEILDSTADDDTNYEAMQKVFDDLTAFKDGTFTLFPGIKRTGQAQVQPESPSQAVISPSPAEAHVDYDLQLGATVFLGIEEYEINAIDDESVLLHDAHAPLFTREMPRAEFDAKIAENPLNAHLLKVVEQASAPTAMHEPTSFTAETDKPETEQEPESESRSEVEPEQEPEPYTPSHGDRYEIQGRLFIVDTVDMDRETVSLRDVTFEGSTGFPIFRSEKLDYVRMFDPIVIDNVGREVESGSDRTTEPDSPQFPLTPSWEKPKQRSRTQSFDPHPGIPMSERHNYRITDDDLGAGGQKAKYRYNVDAIKTLKAIEGENRFATPEEQEILSRYVGWGGIAQAFDPDNASWTNEHAELNTLLTPEEFASARATTLTAYYTNPVVIKAMYKAIENMGFRMGNILDPGCGIGNFQGLVPDSMNSSRTYGIEIDPITGRIAQQLYQKNSIAIQGFESTELPDSFFDLALGNVPFGDYGVVDKKYDKHKFRIHEYFFAKTLDKIRPGGVVAFVTSHFMLDKKDPSIRRYIAQRADFLGAIRLPNNAFLRNAGTEVTTDIIFLQKRDRIIDIEPDWVHLGVIEATNSEGEEISIPINSYFVENPEMMLGTMTNDSSSRMYGSVNSYSCVPFPDADLSDQLSEAIANIHAEISEHERDSDEPEKDNSIPADPTVRNFSYTIVGGQIYFRQDSRMNPVDIPVTAQNRVRGLIDLRECVRTLIEYQTEDYPDADIRTEQAKLGRLYDSFTRKYGLINSRGNSMAFSQDSAYCLLCSLEVLDENGELERKADIFSKRTIRPYNPVTHVDTAVEALAVSMSEKARVDLGYMTELTGMARETLVKELEGVIFLNVGMAASQDAAYVTADEYLSGNVREKLGYARTAAAAIGDGSLDVNVRALEKALPPDLTAAEISVRLGATWLPEDDVQRFMYDLLQTSGYARDRIKVSYSNRLGEWTITEKSADRSNIRVFNTYGTQRIGAYHIIENSLNLRDVRIFDKVYEPDGTEKRVLNKKETAIAQAKQELIRSKFDEWIWTDPERRERLCRIYNDRFNSIRPREYDGSHINFVGMNPEITLRKHQVDAIARVLYGGNTLLAHEVGAGKTYEMVAAAMESKRLGLCSKSLIVVPNHITEQWSGEFLQLYPSANILVATRKDFETKNRRKFCARIATGDYDAVIIGHSQFEKIPMSLERQQDMIARQMDELTDAIEEVKRNRGERFTIKQLERMRKGLEVKLAKLFDQTRKDDVVTFEELGVDRLFIDEAHYYKNLFLLTKMRNVGGIAQVEAQKSSDLFMKTQYLDEITGGRGVIFATGTPISNSMVELYTMQRYLQYKELLKHGLQHFDAWASTFGETVTAIELAPEGTGYRAKTRFAKFYNLPELMSMFKMAADIQTADMLLLPVPQANFHNVVIKPSEFQKEMIAELAERAEAIRGGNVDPSLDNMLKVTNDGRKLALDQRIINPMLPDDPEGKVAVCADKVFRIWDEGKAKRLTQLVFSDLSTPKGEGVFSVYKDLKQKLIEKGIPAEEIAFIHDADTETRKKELFAKVRKGHVRVLLGSTQKMGSGTNVQDRLIALHDLDCPWRPSDLAQRLGRIVRQGNRNPEVEIFRYVTEGTFDSYLYQLVENKQKFIAQVMTSKLPVRMAEDVDETALSYAEIKALATGNPLIIEKAQLESDVNKLKILHASHLSQKYALEDAILKDFPKEMARLGERIAGYTADIRTVTQNTPADKDTFPPMKIGGILYAEKAKAGWAILEACKSMTSPDPVPLGEYRGFNMELSFESYGKEYCVSFKGVLTHDVKLGTDVHGNITRIDNRLDGLADTLKTCEGKLADVGTQLEAAKAEVGRPFTQEHEYMEKSARLKELNILLNMDQKDREILDAEPDEGDVEVPQRAQAWAR